MSKARRVPPKIDRTVASFGITVSYTLSGVCTWSLTTFDDATRRYIPHHLHTGHAEFVGSASAYNQLVTALGVARAVLIPDDSDPEVITTVELG